MHLYKLERPLSKLRPHAHLSSLTKMFNVFRRKSDSSETQKEPAHTQSKRRNSKSTYLTYSPSATVDYNSELNRLDHARISAGIMRCNRL
jgi:hypothetical protein